MYIWDVSPNWETYAKSADGHIHMLAKLHALGLLRFFPTGKASGMAFCVDLGTHDPEHLIVCIYRVAWCDKMCSIDQY